MPRTDDASELAEVLRDMARLARSRWPWLSGEARRRVAALLIDAIVTLEGRPRGANVVELGGKRGDR